jgi:hypothetical protein
MAMKQITFTSVIIINLLAILCLVFWYPQLMVSPGQLMEKHQELTTDCFACHTMFRGSSPEKCMSCHKVSKIGLFTTKGVKIPAKQETVAFHQHLLEEDCVACHSDHRGVKIYRAIKYFSHDLLTPAMQKDCASCHQTPKDAWHKHLAVNCDQCHSQTRWQPAKFKHEWVVQAARKNCETCHDKPKDSLHRQLVGNCDKCHTQTEWKPATFNHDEYFQLDSDHDTECVKCHLNNDYGKYTCYECHEHSPSEIREKHLEEGIDDYERCTECHRNADEDDAKRRWRSRGIDSGKGLPAGEGGEAGRGTEKEDD